MIVKKRKLVHVTKEDITQGERGNCHTCPIALALLRSFKNFAPRVSASVGDFEYAVYTQHPRTAESIDIVANNTTPKMRQFIRSFDSQKDVLPISFSVTYQREI